MTKRGDRLIGIDAAPIIRKAQQELLNLQNHAERVAEVDGRERSKLAPIELHVMTFEQRDGWFRMETLNSGLPGGDLKVLEANRNFLKPEMRMALTAALLESHLVANRDEARRQAALAVITDHGFVKE